MIMKNKENHFENIARSEQSSHSPGCSHQRLYYFQRKDKIVKDFIILNEKTLMTNAHMRYIRVKEGKNENLKKEDKMRISILISIYTIHFAYLKVYIKFHNPNLVVAEKTDEKHPYVLYRSDRRKN